MALLSKNDRIFVAGHQGMVGSAIVQVLREKGYSNFALKTRAELDLTNQRSVKVFFETEKPTVVLLAAAKVGGIGANNTYRAEFISDNLAIQNNIITQSHLNGVHRLIFLGSSCIYPRDCNQPMQENMLLTGPLEYTNRPYALAKIAGLELAHGFRKQYGLDFFSVMPTNLYGPGDNFNLENAHVLPALLRKVIDAKKNGDPRVTIWGSGKPLREFMYSLDCASAIVFLAERLSQEEFEESEICKAGWSHINVGSGDEVSIHELLKLIARVAEYDGQVILDSSRPDGTPRKLLDCSFLSALGWKRSVSLEQGIKLTMDWYMEHRSTLRLGRY